MQYRSETFNGKTTRYLEENGTCYQEGTPETVVKILEGCRLARRKIRIFYGFTEANIMSNEQFKGKRIGLAWIEDFNVLGTVSRSTGALKIPLLIRSSRSLGGGAIMTASIVRIDAKNYRGGIVTLYQHPAFDLPLLEARSEEAEYEGHKYRAAVYADAKPWGRCRTREQADRLVAFLQGKRWAK